MAKFKMRQKVRDTITGLEGLITGIHNWITGCTQYSVQPPAKDGDYKEGHIFDENRLEAVKGVPLPKPERKTQTGCDQFIAVK